jgi:glycosyltransferase involved in cell wall biosynthesis
MLLRNVAALESPHVKNHVAYLVPNRHLETQYKDAGFHPICLDHRRTADGPRTFSRLVALIRQLGVHLVHTNHAIDRLYAGLAARFAGVPAITTAHNTSERQDSAASRFRFRLEAQLMSRFIAVSSAVARHYQSRRSVPSDRIDVIHSGIECGQFATTPSPESLSALASQLGLGDAYPILVNVGRLYSTKGQQYLVPMMSRVLQRWPRAQLLLVGEGPERHRLEAAIREARLERSIHILGLRHDIVDLLSLSTLFVFPSETEGLPIAVLEAMGAGKPVIASRIEPIAEVIEHGSSGLLVPCGDAMAFADAVNRVVSSTELASRMGRRGQELVADRYSVTSTARSMETLYRAVVNR